MTTIHYPIKGRKLEETVTQQTLNMLIAQWENWRQGPGVIGRLNLHSCWGTASVLDRRYQGETVHAFSMQMKVAQTLYEKTKNPRWRILVNSMAAHLLYLQDPSGGFTHATGEFEPTFDTRCCPIHAFSPVITLLRYYQWEYADADIRSLIPAAVDRQWEWSVPSLWKVGNGRFRPLSFPGWCGVTNQDLYAIAVAALTGKLFGKWDRYETYGKPSLDHYLSSAYYYPDMGLFERGDGINYAERTVYYTHVIDMLQLIYDCTGDERLPAVYDNVIAHLFDAVFVGEDGLSYLARGALTDAKDKSHILGWEKGAIAFNGYPKLVLQMQDYLTRHPDQEKAAVVEQLRSTIAAYVFSDGNIPMALCSKNPLFPAVSNPDCEGLLLLVLEVLGDKLEDPQPVDIPCIHRTHQNVTWKQKGRLWAIEADGVRQYGGFSRYSAGITVGPDETPVCGDFATLENADILEIVEG